MKSNDLHQLIKSLKQAEKRYFKIYATRHALQGENNYVLLYNAIESQEVYDEKKIITQFKGKKFTNRFPVAKSYLYDLVLKSLNSYHRQSSLVIKTQELLRSIEILFKKGLFNQCSDIIKKTKKITQKHELFLQELELIKWEKKIANENDKNISENQLLKLSNDEGKVLEICKNINDYENISQNLFSSSYKQGYIKNKDLIKKFETIFKTDLFTSEEMAKSITAKIQFFNIYAEYYRTIDDKHHYYISMKKLMELGASDVYKEQVETKQYISMFFNYLIASFTVKNYTEVLTMLKEFRAIKIKTLKGEASLFVRSHQLEQAVYIAQGRQYESCDLEQRVITGLEHYKGLIEARHLIVLEYQMFYLCFCEARYKEALKWMNKILNGEQQYRKDVIKVAKMINILLHCELENFDLLEHLILSTYRGLQKDKSMTKIEKLIFDFFKNEMENLITHKNSVEIFVTLKDKLTVELKRPEEEKVLDYFNWMIWVDSKITNTTMMSIMLEKSK